LNDQQIAHDKAIAFAQATLLKEVEKDEQHSGHKNASVSIRDQASIFNYNYVESFKYFLNQGNEY
jgi:hypothetical protein